MEIVESINVEFKKRKFVEIDNIKRGDSSNANTFVDTNKYMPQKKMKREEKELV